jgi:hypothetical protein
LASLTPVNTKSNKAIELDDHDYKTKNRSDSIGDSSGYYPIVSVRSNKKYLNAPLKDCKKSNLDARQFYNHENRLYYVYLIDFIFINVTTTAREFLKVVPKTV